MMPLSRQMPTFDQGNEPIEVKTLNHYFRNLPIRVNSSNRYFRNEPIGIKNCEPVLPEWTDTEHARNVQDHVQVKLSKQ